ncbi:hypothetical protein ACFE04_012268 [Oxalis oulophora]
MSSSKNNNDIDNGNMIMKLKTSDNQIFDVEQSIMVNQSQLLTNMAEDGYIKGEIPLQNVDGRILAKVIEWCKKHAKVEKRLEKEEIEIKKWEDSFVKLDQPTLFPLIMAANYLEIESLLDRLCEKVASMIDGKNPEEIRNKFNIKNDFTPREEAALRKENAWAFHE